MLRFLFALMISFCFISNGFAAESDAVVSLFDGTVAEKKVEKKKTVATSEEEDTSIFSFLNFSKKKQTKKEDVATSTLASEKSELEKTIELADKGDVNAQLTLGYLYLYGGEGVEVDYNKAFEYYALAAVQNDNVALNNLGSLYYSGIGVNKDTVKAAVLFEKSANLGNPEAAVNLAFMYISGNGIKKNEKKAIELFEAAAAKGNPSAMFMAGYAALKGFNTPRDYNKAAQYIKSAADNDFDEAQYVLAVMYVNGQGLPQNYGNAVKNLNKASNQGNVDAMLSLGEILALGERYNKDMFTAHIMFNLAAVRGSSAAIDLREKVASKLKIDELLQAQAAAERFQDTPSELSSYIHKTFGTNVRSYIDGK